MNIFTYDFKTLNEYGSTKPRIKSEIAKEPEIYKEISKILSNSLFLDHALAVMGHIKPVYNIESKKYSFTGTMSALDKVYTIEGRAVTKEEISSLVKFLYFYSFSSFCKHPQITGKFNSATPLFLLAQKLYNNIGYNEWDRTDPHLKVALGRELQHILGVTFPRLSEDDYENARVISITDGKGTRHEFTAYKCNKTPHEEITDLKHNFLKHMYLKTWIFYNPNSNMIIDPENWENDLAPTLTKAKPTYLDSLPF